MRTTKGSFLQNPTLNQLFRAVADNHIYWMRDAAESTGGKVYEEEGVKWIYTPHKDQVEIAFPRLKKDVARQTIDRIVRSCRRKSLKRLACWSLSPSQPRDLGAILVARGFGWGWRPRWMWLELAKMNMDHSKPRGLKIDIAGDGDVWDIDDLPFYNRREAESWRVLNHASPRRAWQFIASIKGEVVGQTKLNLTTGALGIAGIYNVGVRPAFRGLGVGKAVITAALQYAKDKGCAHAMLNGTGERVYNQIGFEVIGYGQTWACKEALQTRLPTKDQIAFFEAVGQSDIQTLNRLSKKVSLKVLTKPLASGMTPMKLAVEMGQTASAKWLVEKLGT